MTKDANAKDWSAVLTADGGRLYSDPANVPSGADWQLEAGHYLPAYMPLSIIHPRPAVETQAYAVSRLWPSQTPWVIPIGVQGGAWPFKYEIIDDGGMTGLTIGETLDYATWNSTFRLGEYGVLRCDSPAVGEYTIVVRVTDQEDTTADVTIQVDIVDREDTTKFYWVDATAVNDTGTGAYSDPFKTHNGWYGTSGTDTKSQNKQIHYMAGTYPITDVPLDSGIILTCRVQKAQVLCAVEGEEVIFDGEDTGYLRFSSSSLGDCAVIGVKFINMRSDEFDGLVADKGMGINFQGADAEKRSLVFRCKFDGSTVGDVGSNTSCVFWGDATADMGQYGVMSQCEFIDLSNIMHALTYTIEDFLFEGNYSSGAHDGGAGDSDTARGIFLKGNEHSRITIRANDHFDQPTPLFHMSETTNDRKEDIEIVWNRAYCPAGTDATTLGVGAIGPGGGSPTNDYGPFWMGRNSFRTDRLWFRNLSSTGPFIIENNAVQCGATYVANGGVYEDTNTGAAVVTITGTECVASSGVFDAEMKLTGSYRTSYLGTRGCEIA